MLKRKTARLGDWGVDTALTMGLPEFRDTTVFCYLKDFNGDSVIDEDDTLCIVYTYSNRLYAVNALTHDSLFPSIAVDALNGMKVRVDDFTGDNVPEIITGNAIYSNCGELVCDFDLLSQSPHPPVLLRHQQRRRWRQHSLYRTRQLHHHLERTGFIAAVCLPGRQVGRAIRCSYCCHTCRHD